MEEKKTYRVKFATLGCKLNFAETATIGRQLKERGVLPAGRGEVPDVCVVNTCSVTALADAKCRRQIRKLIKSYPDALMVVTGCYAQLKSQEVAEITGVDMVLGSEQKGEVAEYVMRGLAAREREVVVTPLPRIRKFVPSCECGDRTRYFLKVQDGCNYYCSYCTIPFARGRSRSGSVATLTAQAREVAAAGGTEIVITGVNIGDYGNGTSESLMDLLRSLDAVEGIERYRISSIEPDLLTDEIIEFCAGSAKFMPHFHIPLQSGSDAVLRLMRRHYDSALFAHKVARIKALIPHCFIGVDVMVGTRGETPELFEESYRFIDSLDVTHLHVFPYSERPGTLALKIPYVVDGKTKQERVARMLELSERKQRAFTERYVGSVRPVLLEQGRPGQPMHGFTDNYIRVNVRPDERLANRVVPVRLERMCADLSVDGEVPAQD